MGLAQTITVTTIMEQTQPRVLTMQTTTQTSHLLEQVPETEVLVIDITTDTTISPACSNM